MTNIHGIGYLDEDGVYHGFIDNAGAPQVCAQPYLQALGEGDITNHTPFTKIGYAPAMTAGVNTDVWSYSGTQPVYLFPTSAMGMEVLSSNNVDDISTIIHNGTSTGGSTTQLVSTGENFLTTTAAGDVVVLDKAGTTPEYGYITAVVNDTTLTIAGGFSLGGTGSGRTYDILDVSAKNGAMAVEVKYLDGTYAQKSEIILLNGTTVVPTTNTDIFRVNNFRMIVAGANKVPTGNLTIRHLADTPVYSYITAGFTRARNAQYTVPLGYNLFVYEFDSGYATTGNANKEYARVTTRANVDPTTKFMTDGIFYPFTDCLSQNTTIPIPISCPTRLPEKTDIKVSCIASQTGVVITTIRCWLEPK